MAFVVPPALYLKIRLAKGRDANMSACADMAVQLGCYLSIAVGFATVGAGLTLSIKEVLRNQSSAKAYVQ